MFYSYFLSIYIYPSIHSIKMETNGKNMGPLKIYLYRCMYMYCVSFRNTFRKVSKVSKFFLLNNMYLFLQTQMKKEKKEDIHYKTLLKHVERN